MSEETPKGVLVTTFLTNTINQEFHAQATIVEVKDGHLHVNRGLKDTVAIYAPGKWLAAVVKK